METSVYITEPIRTRKSVREEDVERKTWCFLIPAQQGQNICTELLAFYNIGF